jgi:hypothetical protein
MQTKVPQPPQQSPPTLHGPPKLLQQWSGPPHVDPQTWRPLQVETQVPFEQISQAAQLLPQVTGWPQLLGTVVLQRPWQVVAGLSGVQQVPVGEHTWPAAQQLWPPAGLAHTWAVGQQAPLMQVVVLVLQQVAVVPLPQITVPVGHTPQVGPATLPGGGQSVPLGQHTPWASTVGQQVCPVRQP